MMIFGGVTGGFMQGVRLRRLLSTGAFVAVLVPSVRPAVAEPSPEPSRLDVNGCSLDSVQSWLVCVQTRIPAAQGTVPAVDVPAKLPVADLRTTPLDPAAVLAVRNSGLVATVRDNVTTGAGGTLLLLIAQTRKVGSHGRITFIHQTEFNALRKIAGICSPLPVRMGEAETVCGLVKEDDPNTQGVLDGQRMVAAQVAQPLTAPTTAAAPPVAENPPPAADQPRTDQPRTDQPDVRPSGAGGVFARLPSIVAVLALLMVSVLVGIVLGKHRLTGLVHWLVGVARGTLRLLRAAALRPGGAVRRRKTRAHVPGEQAQGTIPPEFGAADRNIGPPAGTGERYPAPAGAVGPEPQPARGEPRALPAGSGGAVPRPAPDNPAAGPAEPPEPPGLGEPGSTGALVQPAYSMGDPSEFVKVSPPERGVGPAAPPTRDWPEEPAPTVVDGDSKAGGRTAGGAVVPGQQPVRFVAAVVRTHLGPQGYVEIDGLLYRARWMVEEKPRPGPGTTVWVTEHIEEIDGDYRWAYAAPESIMPGERQ